MLAAITSRSDRAHTMRGYAVLGAEAWGLGAITAEAALADVISKSGVSSGTIPASTQSLIQQAVAAGQLINAGGSAAYIPGTADCAASGISGGARDLALAGSGAQMFLTTATSAQVGLIAAGPATLGISIAIAGIVGIFGTLMAHHAQAVKKEQNTLCSAVPAANNYLNIIEQGVTSGQVTPAQAIQALQSLSSGFDTAVSSIRKMGGGMCNAACVMTEMLRAIVEYRTSAYQDLEAAGAAIAASSGSTPISAAMVTSGSTLTLPGTSAQAPAGSSLPSWWPIAAIAVIGLFAMKVL